MDLLCSLTGPWCIASHEIDISLLYHASEPCRQNTMQQGQIAHVPASFRGRSQMDPRLPHHQHPGNPRKDTANRGSPSGATHIPKSFQQCSH